MSYPHGAVPAYPGTVVPAPAAEPLKPPTPDKKTEANVPATIIVSVPADAKLTIDETATASTSTQRVFVTPALVPGKAYHYNMKVEYVQDGKPVVATKKVDVTAGNETKVSFVEEAVATR